MSYVGVRMSRDYYITKSGRLRRKENTIYFETKDMKKVIPVNDINSIYALGELHINTKLLVFLSQNKIPVHFFNYYGYYSGTYYPREYLQSGFLTVKQVECYLDEEKRLQIAKELVNATVYNIIKNLQHYKKHGKNVTRSIEKIKKEERIIDDVGGILELMGTEGRIRDFYYNSFNEFLREGLNLKNELKDHQII